MALVQPICEAGEEIPNLGGWRRRGGGVGARGEGVDIGTDGEEQLERWGIYRGSGWLSRAGDRGLGNEIPHTPGAVLQMQASMLPRWDGTTEKKHELDSGSHPDSSN